MEYLLLILLSYLLGSLPTGLIVGKVTKGIDLRAYGSGKTGAANTLRTLGPGAFAVVFLVDFAKAFAAVGLAGLLIGTPAAQVLAGLSALVGHNWSLYMGFSGGRGVAPGIGALFAMSPGVSAIVTAATISIILLSRYISLGSVVGGIVALLVILGAVVLGLERPVYLFYVVPGAVIVIYQHRDNIERLIKGTERKLGDPVTPQH